MLRPMTSDPRLHRSPASLCSSSIAWRKLGSSYLHSALHPRRMFDKSDVYGDSCEQGTRENSDKFGDLAHNSPKSAILLCTCNCHDHAPRFHGMLDKLMGTCYLSLAIRGVRPRLPRRYPVQLCMSFIDQQTQIPKPYDLFFLEQRVYSQVN